eukprot:2039322-Pleurochrysis_carterae.AAC.1
MKSIGVSRAQARAATWGSSAMEDVNSGARGVLATRRKRSTCARKRAAALPIGGGGRGGEGAPTLSRSCSACTAGKQDSH